jgi:hypothetical protein
MLIGYAREGLRRVRRGFAGSGLIFDFRAGTANCVDLSASDDGNTGADSSRISCVPVSAPGLEFTDSMTLHLPS